MSEGSDKGECQGDGSVDNIWNTGGRFLCVDKFEYTTRRLCQENRPRDTTQKSLLEIKISLLKTTRFLLKREL